MAPPAGAECSEHPEGGHAHLQRHWTVRSQSAAPSLPLLSVGFALFLSESDTGVLQEERRSGWRSGWRSLLQPPQHQKTTHLFISSFLYL